MIIANLYENRLMRIEKSHCVMFQNNLTENVILKETMELNNKIMRTGNVMWLYTYKSIARVIPMVP